MFGRRPPHFPRPPVMIKWIDAAPRALAGLYNRTMDTRRFYRHTLKRDANGTERLWHFWARKSAAMLFLATCAGGMCAIPATFVLLWVLYQFGLDLNGVLTFRAVCGASSVAFFVYFILQPPHRPRWWE
jgi:hypothetical protein